jgi:hypothetical protein
MYEQLIDLAEWGTSETTLVFCATTVPSNNFRIRVGYDLYILSSND